MVWGKYIWQNKKNLMATSVMLHHDAITGTHFDIVENNYNEIISNVFQENEERLSNALKQ